MGRHARAKRRALRRRGLPGRWCYRHGKLRVRQLALTLGTGTGTTFKPFTAKGDGAQPLIMWLTQATSPRPDFEFHEVQHPQGPVVVLDIKAPRTAPLAFAGVRYIRIDSHKTKLSDHPDKELRIWDFLGQKSDWSGEIVPDATVADLDPEALDAARKRFTEYLLKAEPDTSRHEHIRADAQGTTATNG